MLENVWRFAPNISTLRRVRSQKMGIISGRWEGEINGTSLGGIVSPVRKQAKLIFDDWMRLILSNLCDDIVTR